MCDSVFCYIDQTVCYLAKKKTGQESLKEQFTQKVSHYLLIPMWMLSF